MVQRRTQSSSSAFGGNAQTLPLSGGEGAMTLLSKDNPEEQTAKAFYHCCIESTQTYCITAWYVNCAAADRKNIQTVINTCQKIVGLPLPTLEDIFRTRRLLGANNILKDDTHPCHQLFSLLPSGRHYRAITTVFFPLSHH